MALKVRESCLADVASRPSLIMGRPKYGYGGRVVIRISRNCSYRTHYRVGHPHFEDLEAAAAAAVVAAAAEDSLQTSEAAAAAVAAAADQLGFGRGFQKFLKLW